METYRLEEFVTSGWEPLGPEFSKLSKAVAKQKMDELIAEGHNPTKLRPRRDDR